MRKTFPTVRTLYIIMVRTSNLRQMGINTSILKKELRCDLT